MPGVKAACPECLEQVPVIPVKGKPDWWKTRKHYRGVRSPGAFPCPGSGVELHLGTNPTLALNDDPLDRAVPEGEQLEGHATPIVLVQLPDTLVGGLTVYTKHVAMQVQPAHCANDDAVVILAIKDDAPRDPATGNVLLDPQSACVLRDLLNIATARGAI